MEVEKNHALTAQMWEEMYLLLFRASTKAVQQIQEHNFGLAQELLLQAQQQAEDAFLAWGDRDEKTETC